MKPSFRLRVDREGRQRTHVGPVSGSKGVIANYVYMRLPLCQAGSGCTPIPWSTASALPPSLVSANTLSWIPSMVVGMLSLGYQVLGRARYLSPIFCPRCHLPRTPLHDGTSPSSRPKNSALTTRVAFDLTLCAEVSPPVTGFRP